MDINADHMRRAVRLARRTAVRNVSPNPRVGAVIVKNGRIIGEGRHKKFGGPHAEVYALETAGMDAAGADLYVTLEPCSHHGKTPACAPQIVSAGLKRVFVANIDPNPLVSGRGLNILREAGIEVFTGVLASEAASLNQPFLKVMQTGLPYIILKSARTLDGFIAEKDGSSRWISSAESRKTVHSMRASCDAVMVGIGTVLADDPGLDTRLVKGPDPQVIIFDNTFSLTGDISLFRNRKGRNIWVLHPKNPPLSYLNLLKEEGARSLEFTDDTGEGLADALKELAEKGIQSILVEGGPGLHRRFTSGRLADRLMLFTAPRTLGTGIPDLKFPASTLAMPAEFSSWTWKQSGGDILFDGIWNEYCS